MDPIYSADQTKKPVEGDFVRSGVITPTGDVSDIRNPKETEAQNLIQPAVITSQMARKRAAQDMQKLRGFRTELTKVQEEALLAPPTPVQAQPTNSFTPEEVEKVFGGDLSNFSYDKANNRFVPQEGVEFDPEAQTRIHRNRNIGKELTKTISTLEVLKKRSDPATATLLNSIQRRYENRARSLMDI